MTNNDICNQVIHEWDGLDEIDNNLLGIIVYIIDNIGVTKATLLPGVQVLIPNWLFCLLFLSPFFHVPQPILCSLQVRKPSLRNAFERMSTFVLPTSFSLELCYQPRTVQCDLDSAACQLHVLLSLLSFSRSDSAVVTLSALCPLISCLFKDRVKYGK